MISRILCVLPALLLSTTLVFAHSFQVGDLKIGHPYALPSIAQQLTGAAYLSIENTGQSADRLLSVSTQAARSATLHTMTMDGNIMRMREADAMTIKPGATVVMKPGMGFHIMLTGLKSPLKVGDRFPITLTFEKNGKLEVTVVVQDKEARSAAASGSASASGSTAGGASEPAPGAAHQHQH
ncbi:MAG: rane protein [Herminiimonas sp.]|nr:rane protein [Herminiimonas sp.]